MPQLDVTTFNTQMIWIAIVLVLSYGFWSIVAVPMMAGSIKSGVKYSDTLNTGSADDKFAVIEKNASVTTGS
jgi:hypothetical protein